MRLAAVIAEIAHNETNCTPAAESVCTANNKVEEDNENP
jgi:hypothetical protein